jgi:hypothetical protein
MVSMSNDNGMVQELHANEATGPGWDSIRSKGGFLNAGAHGIDESGLWLPLAFMVIWYGFWLWISAGPVSHRPADNFTFNSMFAHLLHGQFDVDPQIIGNEGYRLNGHVYAYWGIWCALLRFPLWILRRMDVDMTVWSCLAAVCIAGMAKLRTVFLLRRYSPQSPTAKSATDLMLVYIVMGGSETSYLRAIIFQEVMFWAAAFAAIFVYFAIKGLLSRDFDLGTLCWMAFSAGLALLTRVSTGIGLILALGLLLLTLAVQSSPAAPNRWLVLGQWKHILRSRRTLIPLGILALCIAVTGAVNYFRWGNPMTFVDYRLYIGNHLWPDRIPRESMYGLFNVSRIPFGLLYYFFPIWTLRTTGGHFLFAQTQARLFDVIELPSSSFLLTDLLPLCFIAFLVIAVVRRRSGMLPPVSQWAALAAGLMAPCILMLTAIAMTHRYRMEFYPEIDFLAFLGLYSILNDEKMRAEFTRCRNWVSAALVVSAVASFTVLILYQHAPLGPAQELLRKGIAQISVLWHSGAAWHLG